MTFTVYLDDKDIGDIEVEADGYEIDSEKNLVNFKLGLNYVGAFRIDKIIGIARDSQ